MAHTSITNFKVDTGELSRYQYLRKNSVDFMREYMCDWAEPAPLEPPETKQKKMATANTNNVLPIGYQFPYLSHVATPVFKLKVPFYRSPEEIKEIIIKELSEFWLVHLILSIDPDNYTKRRTEEIMAENTIDKPPVYDNVGQINVKDAIIRDWNFTTKNMAYLPPTDNYITTTTTGIT